MFSTIDSPGARFIRIYLIDTVNGYEYAVSTPRELALESLKLRTFPLCNNFREFAFKVNNGNWLALSDESPVSLYLKTQSNNDQVILDDNLEVGADNEEAPIIVMVPDVSLYPNVPSLAFDTTRIELWTYTFDPANYQLQGHIIKTLSVNRSTSFMKNQPECAE